MKSQTKLALIFLVMMTLISSCRSVSQSSADQSENKTYLQKSFGDGVNLEFYFEKGKHHNYPSFAVWIESLNGETVQTLFVTKSVATGYYTYGDAGDGHWLKVSGPAVRPASLPYWLHRREIGKVGEMPSPDQPLPDAYTGATPAASFNMNIQSNDALPERFKVLVEVNQPWDWNKYWTNSKYENNPQYRTSAQPALVYAVEVDLINTSDTYYLNPIGHSHYAGADGMLYTNLKTFTTALEIFDSITLKIKK
jgi:hypothetical protein